MFTDLPFLSVAADLRHRDLLAEAEEFRLAKLVRAARRVTRAAPASAPPRPPDIRPPATDASRARVVAARAGSHARG